MKRHRVASRSVVMFLLLAPLAVMSTPPSIPWDVFDVKGTVVRAGGSPAGHTVVLVHRHCRGSAEQWCHVTNCDAEGTASNGPFTPVALTNGDGRFYLRVAVCNSHSTDTLAVAVVYPDTMLLGDPFRPADFQSTPITRTGHYEDQGFFCDNDEEFEYEVGRIYSVRDTILVAP